MNIIYSKHKRLRPMAWLFSVLLMVPFFTACSGGSRNSNNALPPPVDNTRAAGGIQNYPANANAPQAKKKGLSNTQKVAILAGAAALYYLYTKHKNSKAEGAEGKYYLSKNGRVYYRDAQHKVHWVTPPSEGIRVPESEAQQYRDFQGYNKSTSGRSLQDVARNLPPTQLDPVPAQ